MNKSYMNIYISVLLLLLLILLNRFFKESMKNNYKIAIITSIYGDYDDIKEPNVHNSDKVDWFCFTDSKTMKSNTWKIINTPYHINNTKDIDEYKKYKNYYNNIKDDKIKNMMSAKYYKIKTHEIDILKHYDYYIWIDGAIELKYDFIDRIMDIINEDNINIINFKHSQRENIKDEAKYSEEVQERYRNQECIKQANEYINSGYPDNNGLYELTVYIKRNRDDINNIYDKWWLENLKYSFQDQISYPYILWKYKQDDRSGIPDYIINENVFDSSYTKHSGHMTKNYGV